MHMSLACPGDQPRWWIQGDGMGSDAPTQEEIQENLFGMLESWMRTTGIWQGLVKIKIWASPWATCSSGRYFELAQSSVNRQKSQENFRRLIAGQNTVKMCVSWNPNTNWRAPCKPALCDYFVAIFQVAQNRLKFGMLTPFLWKDVPPLFFTSGETRPQTRSWNSSPNSPPPPPTPPDREGGVEFDAILSIFFCILDKKHRDIF